MRSALASKYPASVRTISITSVKAGRSARMAGTSGHGSARPAGTQWRAVWYRLDTAVRYQRGGHAFTRSQLGPHGFRGRGVDPAAFLWLASLANQREVWETILQKLRAGEMPPKGEPRPQAEIDTLVKYVQGEFDKADRNAKPDPGRVTAHRLNRTEYANTIRDLLDVEFRAQKDFPTDDSGEGFDNIGDILTISPVLMEKYMAAAERIASRAIATDPLPKAIAVEYSNKDKRVRRVDASTIEATHRIDFDGEYTVRVALPAERPAAAAKPVMLGFWMDGKPIGSKMVETKPSGLVFFDPYSEI